MKKFKGFHQYGYNFNRKPYLVNRKLIKCVAFQVNALTKKSFPTTHQHVCFIDTTHTMVLLYNINIKAKNNKTI